MKTKPAPTLSPIQIDKVKADLLRLKFFSEMTAKSDAEGKAMPIMIRMMADLMKMHETLFSKIDDINEVIKNNVGPQGEKPSEEELRAIIEPLIEQPEDGHTPTESELLSLITPLIPDVEDGYTPSDEELLALIKPLIPKMPKVDLDRLALLAAEKARGMIKMLEAPKATEIDHEALAGIVLDKIVKGKKLKMEHLVDGMQQTESVARRFLANGSKHGGGDTVAAGPGVSIADVNGQKVISALGASGTAVRDEVPTGSGTAFTLAHTPTANTLQLFRGGSRQQPGAGNDYTITGANITLAVALATGEILLADYNY
ncbi:MAG: hypothetical protein V4438_04260 [Patescibacteria group bacterium]